VLPTPLPGSRRKALTHKRAAAMTTAHSCPGSLLTTGKRVLPPAGRAVGHPGRKGLVRQSVLQVFERARTHPAAFSRPLASLDFLYPNR